MVDSIQVLYLCTVGEGYQIWEWCSSAGRQGISNAKLLIHVDHIAGFGRVGIRPVFLVNQFPALS